MRAAARLHARAAGFLLGLAGLVFLKLWILARILIAHFT